MGMKKAELIGFINAVGADRIAAIYLDNDKVVYYDNTTISVNDIVTMGTDSSNNVVFDFGNWDDFLDNDGVFNCGTWDTPDDDTPITIEDTMADYLIDRRVLLTNTDPVDGGIIYGKAFIPLDHIQRVIVVPEGTKSKASLIL